MSAASVYPKGNIFQKRRRLGDIRNDVHEIQQQRQSQANAQSVSPDEGRCAEAYGGNFNLRTEEGGVQQKQAVDVKLFVHHCGTQQ